jgi:hypothetical protein
MKKRITILTTTHYRASAHRLLDSYGRNHDRKFTHTKLIEVVIKDLYDKIGSNDINHIISLDHDSNNDGSNEYLNNLLKLEKIYPNLKIIYTEGGIYDSIRNLINHADTDYYLYWEHDWEFVNNMDLNEFISLMDKYENINYIRFNKRHNVAVACDYNLWDTDDIPEMNLLRTSGWSQNPYVGRKSKMLDWIKMMDETEEDFDPTIELFLQTKMRDDIKNMGIDRASDEWGVFLYGNLNDASTVSHLNGQDK